MKKGGEFIRKHRALICVIILCIIVIGYFVNLVFIKNKKDVISILVLSTDVDRDALSKEIKEAVPLKQGEEISIQTLDYEDKVNQGVAVTWLRSGTIDLLAGDKEQMTVFGHYGYLRRLDETGLTTDKAKFTCGLADFDDDGNILDVKGDDWVGAYPDRIAGINGMEAPVVSMLVNAPDKENSLKVLERFLAD